MKTFMNAEPKTRLIAVALSFLSLCFASLICFPGLLEPPARLEPTIDVDKIYTQAAQTIQAQYPTQANTATRTASLQPTNTIIASSFEDPTETAIPSVTIKPGPASCIQDSTPETGTVVDIIDGDTIKVLIDGATYSLRYVGIDTPENTTEKEYYGAEATNRNAELVYAKVVTLYSDVSDKDLNGRLLRYVFIEDQFINLVLVQEGYASAYRYEPDTACSDIFAKAETKPKRDKIGMWGAPPTLEYVAPVVPLATQPAPGGSSGSVGFDNNGDGKVTCADFSTQRQAQDAYDAGHTQLDGNDNDGKACESLP